MELKEDMSSAEYRLLVFKLLEPYQDFLDFDAYCAYGGRNTVDNHISYVRGKKKIALRLVDVDGGLVQKPASVPLSASNFEEMNASLNSMLITEDRYEFLAQQSRVWRVDNIMNMEDEFAVFKKFKHYLDDPEMVRRDVDAVYPCLRLEKFEDCWNGLLKTCIMSDCAPLFAESVLRRVPQFEVVAKNSASYGELQTLGHLYNYVTAIRSSRNSGGNINNLINVVLDYDPYRARKLIAEEEDTKDNYILLFCNSDGTIKSRYLVLLGQIIFLPKCYSVAKTLTTCMSYYVMLRIRCPERSANLADVLLTLMGMPYMKKSAITSLVFGRTKKLKEYASGLVKKRVQNFQEYHDENENEENEDPEPSSSQDQC